MSNIDDIFKKGLDGSGMEYSDASWASMEQVLGAKKVGFFARYKLLLGIGGLLLVSSLALFYFNTKDTTKNTPEVVSDGKTESTSNDGLNTNNELSNNAISSSQNTERDLAENVVKEQSVNSGNRKSKAVRTQDAVATIDGVTKVTSESSSTLKTDTYKDPSDNEFRSVEPISDIGTVVNNTLYEVDNTFTSAENSAADFSEVPSIATRTSEVLTKPNFGSIISAKRILVSDFEQTQNTNYPGELDFLPNLKHKKFSFYISPYAGYLMYAKSVNTPQFLTDEEANLGKSEAQNTYNYGLTIGIKKGQWMLSSGLGFLSLREKTFYTDTKLAYQYTTAPRISNTNFTTTPRGTRVALVSQQKVDSTLVTSTQQVCEGCEASFDYVSVPLSVQYNFGKSRLRYFTEMGLTASFLQNASGEYATLKDVYSDLTVVPSSQIVDLSISDDVSKILLQANVALGAKFWLTPKWNLWTSYGYGMGLSSMLGSYEQKPTIKNLRVGLEFKLR